MRQKKREKLIFFPPHFHPPFKKEKTTQKPRIKKKKQKQSERKEQTVREQNERILTDERANDGKRVGEKESERGNPSGFCLLRRLSELYRRDTSSSHGESLDKDPVGVSATSTTSESLESNGLDTEIPAAARRPRSTRGSQKWSNVRAVMALYSSLRKIKRYSRHCSNMDGNLSELHLSLTPSLRSNSSTHRSTCRPLHNPTRVHTHTRSLSSYIKYTRVFRTFVATRRLRLTDTV